MHVRPLVEVKKRSDRKLIEVALTKPDVLAFVLVIGALEAVPTDTGKRRVLDYVADVLHDQQSGVPA